MCSVLADKGHIVTLIASSSLLGNSWVRPSPWNEQIGQAGRLSRIRLALRAALSEDADVYHFHDPELISLGLVLKLLRPSKAVVYDVHEDYPSMMREKYYIPAAVRPIVVGCAHIANAVAGIFFDGIVTADPGVEQDFRRFAGEKTLTYYNFPQLSVFEPCANGKNAIADLVYIGGMSDRSGIFVLLKALSLLADEGLRPSVRLAGYTDGEAGRSAIEEAVKARSLSEQIDLRGRIPHADVPGWIRSGRIGLVMLQSIPKFMKNIPSKLFEYWACGLPVIASDLPPIRQFLLEGQNGLFFRPSSPKDLARVIRYLLEHPDEAKSMGDFAQTLVCNKWNVDRQIDDLITFYEKIHSS